MDVTLVARPALSVFLPRSNTGRRLVGPEEGKAGTVAGSRGSSSFMDSSTLQWVRKYDGSSQGTPQPCQSPLVVECCKPKYFSRRVDGTQSATIYAAQNLGNVNFKSLEKKNRQLLGWVVQKPGNFHSEYVSMEATSNFPAPFRNSRGRRNRGDAITASRANANDESDDPGICGGDSLDKNAAGRFPLPRASWMPYASGMATFACAGGAAAKHILSGSAHARLEQGGGSGQQPPPPGPGEGGGGGGGGDFDAGSNGDGLHAKAVLERERTRGEAELPPTSVSLRRRARAPSTGPSKEPRNSPRRMRALASLSAAAGDLIEGEGLVREELMSGEMGHHPKFSEFNAGKTNFDGPREGSPPDSEEDEQNPGNIFFGEDDSGTSSDRPPVASPSGESDKRGNASLPVARSTAGDSSGHSLSGSTPKFAKSPANGDKHSNGSGDPDNYFTRSSGRNSHEVPPEFSSIRGKITEIPGFVQDGDGKMRDQPRESPPGFGFSGWVGGLFKSIMGNGGDGTENQEADDERKALVSEVAARTLQIISNQASESGLATSSETGALRRLQRETFSDLMKMRERLDKMEHVSGLRHGKYPANGPAGAKTVLKGHVSSGGAFVLVEDATGNLSRFALQHAGMLTGLDVRFTFESPMRLNDLLITQCGVGQVSGESDGSVLGGPISLQKITYMAQITDSLSLSVSPLGAKAHDVTDTVNHLQGQALTAFSGSGPALYQHCKGSAFGVNLRSKNVLLSMAQFLSGWGSKAADAISGPLCLSTLAQFVVQPCEHMVFSLSAVNTAWPSPPLPSSNGLHWSEMGPLVLCKTVTRPTQHTGFSFNDLLPTSSNASFLSQIHLLERDSWNPDAESRPPLGSTGAATQSVAVSGEVDVGGSVSLGGWAQLERGDWLEELRKKDFQWHLSLAKSTGPIIDWGLSVGSKKREYWGEDGLPSPTGGDVDNSSSQLQMEAFVKWRVGQGFTLQPGLVYVLDKDTQTPAVMLRSSWNL